MLSSEDVLNGVRMSQLENQDATTWSDSVLIVALNKALNMLTLARPDATAKTAIVDLQAGARQTIPADGVRLIRVVCNVTEDNQADQVIRLVEKEDLDSSSRAWMYATGPSVSEYMFDERVPKQYHVYPNAPAGSKVEIEYSRIHTKLLVSGEDDIDIDEVYEQPLIEFMLYRLQSGLGDINSGALHLRTALDLLGVKDNNNSRLDPAKKTGS